MAYTVLEIARRDVPKSLKDPDSVRFQNLFSVKTDKGGLLVCGELNAKNSFGGYTGFKKFMWNTSITVIEGSVEDAEFAKAWNSTCAKWQVLASAKE